MPRPRRHPALRRARRRRARCSSATRPPTATSPSGSGATGSTGRTPSARSSTAARSSRTAPTRRSRSSTRSQGIRAGVLRTLDERPAWRAEQALTVEQALHASTVAPAWLAGDERRRGKLLPGFLADLVVLDRDPVTCPVEELASSRSSRRWSAAAGCTTRRPGTDARSTPKSRPPARRDEPYTEDMAPEMQAEPMRTMLPVHRRGSARSRRRARSSARSGQC